MKKLKSILSVAVMSVLIFSTVGFSVSRHYCMGNLVDESFYHLAQKCAADADDHCDADKGHFDVKCCDDEILSIAGLQVQSTPQKHLGFDAPFAAVPFIAHAALQLSTPFLTFQALKDPPGLRAPSGRQILLLVQRFLI